MEETMMNNESQEPENNQEMSLETNQENQGNPGSQGKPESQGNQGATGFQAMVDPSKNQDVDPATQRKLEDIKAMTINFMYSDKTKASVKQMVSGKDYQKTVPMAATSIYKQLQMFLKKDTKKPLDLDTKLAIGLTAFSETMELAQAMGAIPQDVSEDETESMLRKVMQDEIQAGLKSGEIDPIELQSKIETILPDNMKQEGSKLVTAHGGSEKPTQQMVDHMRKQNIERPLRTENEMLKDQNKQTRTALTGMQNAVPTQGKPNIPSTGAEVFMGGK